MTELLKKVNVFDVTAFILKKCGRMTAMKLQKLVYYCQAWSLVWDEKPLFPEKIEAWANSPIVRKLFEAHRGKFMVRSIPDGNPKNLSDVEKETVSAVLDYYGKMSSQELSDLIHLEYPWKKTRKGMREIERGSKEISHALMEEYYGNNQGKDSIRD